MSRMKDRFNDLFIWTLSSPKASSFHIYGVKYHWPFLSGKERNFSYFLLLEISMVVDPDWIRIQWGAWIRIRNTDPGARKRRKNLNLYIKISLIF
jgi:hypothetical protein